MALTRRARRRLGLLFVVGFLLVVVVGVAWLARQIIRERNANVARSEGMALWEAGDYEAALPRLSTAVSRNREDVDLLIAFADARSRIPQPRAGHLVRGVAVYRRALLIEPENLVALNGLLRLQVRAGMIAQLTDTANAIRSIDPESAEPLRVLKDVAIFRGRLGPVGDLQGTDEDDSAMRWTDELIALEPDVVSHRLERVAIMRQTGTPDSEILEMAEQWATDDDQADGRFEIVLAHTRFALGQTELAEAAVLDGIEKGLDDPTSLLIASDLLNRVGNRERSGELMEQAQNRAQTERTLARAMIMQPWRDGFVNRTRDRLVQYEDVLSDEPMDLLMQVQLFAAIGDEEQARSVVEKLESMEFDRDMDAGDIQEIDAWITFLGAIEDLDFQVTSEKEIIEGVQRAETAATQISNREMASQILGDLYQRIGLVEIAMSHYRSAQDRSGVLHVVPGQRLLGSLLRQGREIEALPVSELMLRRHPNSPTAIMNWIKVRCAIEREGMLASELGAIIRPYQTAYELADSIVAADQRDLQFKALLLEAAIATGRITEASEIARSILQDDEVLESNLVTLAQLASGTALMASDPTLLDDIHAALLAREADRESLDRVLVLRTLRLRDQGMIDEAEDLLASQLGARDDAGAARIRAMEDIDNVMARGTERMPERFNDILEQDIGYQPLTALLAKSIQVGDLQFALRIRDHIEELFGESSLPVILAEADLVLGFPDNPDLREEPYLGINKLVGALELQLEQEPNATNLVFRQYQLLDLMSPQDKSASTELLLQTVNARPDAMEFYPPLILHLQQMGRFRDAERFIQRFERSNVKVTPELRESIDYLRMFQGDPASALASLKKSAEEPDATIETRLRYAEYLAISMRVAQAEALLERLMNVEDRPVGVDRQYAAVLARLGRQDEAFEVLGTAPGFSNETNRLLAISSMHMALEQPADALKALEAQPELFASSSMGQLLAGRACIQLGELDKAKVYLRKAIDLEDSETVRMQVATSMLAEPGMREEAVALLRSTLVRASNPGMIETALLGAQAADAEGVFRPTDEQLDQVVALTRRYPGLKSAWTLAGNFHLESVKDVEQRIRRLLNDENNLDMERLLQLRDLQVRRTEGLLELLANAINRFAADPAFPRLRASVQLERGENADALRFANMAAERTPGDRLIDASIQGTALSRLGRYSSVVSTLGPHEMAIIADNRELPPGTPYTIEYRHLVDALMRLGRMEEAERILNASGSTTLQVRHWETVARELDFVNAKQAIEVLANRLSGDMQGELRLVSVWTHIARNTGNPEALEQAFEGIESIQARLKPGAQGVAGSPLFAAHVLMTLATIQDVNSMMDARSTYRAVIDRIPSGVRAGLGRMRELNQQELSRVLPWRELLVLSLNNYAANSAILGLELASALDAANEATMLAPNTSEILDTRAMVHNAMGNYDAAVADALMAQRLSPDALGFRMTLAEAHAGMDNTGLALELLDEIDRMNIMSDRIDDDIRDRSAVLREQLLLKQAG